MAVIGASPVTFISEDHAGTQVQIPLSALTISHGAVSVSGTWHPALPGQTLGAKDTTLVTNLLKQLLARGVISAPPS